ncbi:hypothetical protein GCM10022265_20740 [Marinobacter xestospongiae]
MASATTPARRLCCGVRWRSTATAWRQPEGGAYLPNIRYTRDNDWFREPLINSGSPLAFRAVHTQGAALQEGWLPFKKAQRRVWIALKAPKGAI